ncbi:ADP-ribosylation factor-like protein 6-interacting protein 4 isoform X2 [Ruditapes philippinarum]|uniref:ADP-ribosylation factor-like protein 6-interacting protein 4 isoform X2 n=1 Tax=Ruditapes philippinarum TaxID=129788 RepID=UPI00295B27F2|nr:ADP-ribosylation factor-like protein 6-interacting protein 4 isoform X2 [Ruditapes philippinarum]
MKSCSMGRSSRDRKKRTRVSEEEEQKKIRDSILKVFQARLSTPGKGGALLVAEPRPTEKSKHKKQKKHRVSTSTSTDDSSFQSMSGRGRKRTKSLSRRKSRKITKQKKEVEKDTAVAKHLRVAHGITDTSAGIKNDIRNKPKMYSHSRITVSDLIYSG